ncbi:iron(III) transport system ATP-binding protein [Conyzicola lurida]|uniref:ABC-type quaternary amine transporter n=1 Tax=Conyzicola lurida TaxID=1172621 RepID=A0A841AQC5_9MICO|nr:iron(III) transport system ATP-binding protein [Conyzicola lurida]
MSSVTLTNVGLTYPDGTVGLDGIDLAIADGEFVALVGPSGSGKTTLLRAIAGFLRPTAGSIHLGEALVADGSTLVAPEKRELGMVFQQHAVWPHWSVERNVAYPLRLAGVAKAERQARVAEVMALVGLEGFEKRNPATLSGGQRQRVALARAIVGRPRVLLLDEALSALDEPLRDSLRLELQTLTRSIGLTVVHVTHDRDEALALADRVVVLDGGRIQQVGTPPELVSTPASPAVATFLSDATVFTGVLHAGVFSASGHGCRVGVDDLELGGAGEGDGSIAVLPEDVTLTPGTGATVTSSLYGRGSNDVVVDWNGIAVRCRVPGRRPLVGEAVDVRVERAMFYPRAAAAQPVGTPA